MKHMDRISSTWVLTRPHSFRWNVHNLRAEGDTTKPERMLPGRMHAALIFIFEDKGWDPNSAAIHEPLLPSVLTFLMDGDDCIH